MSVILVFLLVVAGVASWWLSHQRLMSKPWLETNEAGDFIPSEQYSMPTEKIFLGAFLAVVGALFALFASAYFMRMGVSDWRPLPIPGLLWFNTGALLASSVALHIALSAARHGQRGTMRLGLATAALTGTIFLIGQLAAWRALADDGFILAGNPANSFFYLITGLHGLHIVGGLAGLAHVIARSRDPSQPTKLLVPGIDLCAMYFHFLLFIWLGIFMLVAGWAAHFVDICRQLIT